jgi:hypothetical protein
MSTPPIPPFTVRNHDILRELFKLLGVSFSETDYVANAAIAQKLCVTEHRQVNVTYSDDALLLRVLPLGERMEMLGETRPVFPHGDTPRPNRMNSSGGTRPAVIRRFRLRKELEDEGLEAGTFLFWGGQRLRRLDTGETLEELIAFTQDENPSILNDLLAPVP